MGGPRPPGGLFVHYLAAVAAETHFFAVFEGFHLDPGRAHALVAHEHDVGPIDHRFALYNAALTAGAPGTGMALDKIDVLDKDSAFFPVDLKHFTDLTFVFSGNYFYFVIFFEMASLLDHGLFLHAASAPTGRGVF
jgi:hypothetical protein